MRLWRSLALAFLVTALASTSPTANTMVRAPKAHVDRVMPGLTPAVTWDLDRVTSGGATLGRFLRGSTVKTFNSQHGTQIEYLAANGNTYLWYPGNRVILAGRWRTKSIGRYGVICFKYSRNSYNPFTRKRGGQWNCEGSLIYLTMNAEIRRGDPLGLSSGRLPFVLPRGEDISISSAYQRIGGSGPLHPDRVIWPPRPR